MIMQTVKRGGWLSREMLRWHCIQEKCMHINVRRSLVLLQYLACHMCRLKTTFTGRDRKRKFWTETKLHTWLCYTFYQWFCANDSTALQWRLLDVWMNIIHICPGSSSRSSNSHPLISSALYSWSNLASSESESDGSRVLSWDAIGESLLEWLGDAETLKERDRFVFSACSLISIWSTGRGTDSNSMRSLSMVVNRSFTSGSSFLHKL